MDHVVIECVSPELDAGRHPVKRIVGDTVWVGADIFKEGHDLLAAGIDVLIEATDSTMAGLADAIAAHFAHAPAPT